MRGGGWHDPVDGPQIHTGYVAGRYRDGAWSDWWTDVDRCAEGTFTAYAAACTCGWRGAPRPATRVGQHAAGHRPLPAAGLPSLR